MARSQVWLQLRLTPYERVSIGLTSVLLMLGATTLLLFLLWLSRTNFVAQHPAQLAFAGVAPQTGAETGAIGGELSLPGDEELPDVDRPPTVMTPESIAATVESQVVALDALSSDDGLDGRSRGTEGSIGDRFGPDTSTSDHGGRWMIRFSATSLEEYKRQLDHFDIELGIAGGGISTVDYVQGFTAKTPVLRLGQDPKQEKRLRFLYRDGPLKEADRQLARAAGINVEGRIVFQFHSQKLYETLLKLEFEKMRPRRIIEVVRTVFGVRPTADGYEFYVIEQDYRVRGVSSPKVRPI